MKLSIKKDWCPRLNQGGEIDRSITIPFKFDGKRYQGYQGDTLASALLANGVQLVGRSFKYHRPRGIFSAGTEEPNALVELRTGRRREPNTRATTVELFPDLSARSQNCWPSLKFDVLQVNSLLAPIFAAGFYYKTFMGVPGWHFYEYFIRRAAGMGSGTHEIDPDIYDKSHAYCDLLIVGGGPAGIAAALVAGKSGLRVILLEESDTLGGRLRGDDERLDGEPGLRWVRESSAKLSQYEDVSVMTRTTAFGYYDGNAVSAVERVSDYLTVPSPYSVRQRLWHIRARHVILATGATERPLVFTGNDRPGVMLANAARTYVNRFAVRPGKRAVIFANNDDAYRTALDLFRAKIDICAVVDSRHQSQGFYQSEARASGILCLPGSVIKRTYGHFRLTGVEIATLDEDCKSISKSCMRVDCDLLAISGGWSPNIHLHLHTGGRPIFSDSIAAFIPDKSQQGEQIIGAAAGVFSLHECLLSGRDAGCNAAQMMGFSSAPLELPVTRNDAKWSIKPLWQVPGRGTKFVDLQDDVTSDDIDLAHLEGYVSMEHLKRYTTLGMGTDQGKTSNMNGHAIMADKRGISIQEAGTTTFRPPYSPVALGTIAGRDIGANFAPTRHTPLHDWHIANGAQFIETGDWKRPRFYLREGEKLTGENIDRAITREVIGTRNSVGVIDISTLGKIDIQGPDAAEFLNRLWLIFRKPLNSPAVWINRLATHASIQQAMSPPSPSPKTACIPCS